MFEVKVYENFNDLINDTKTWLDQNYQNFPFDFRVNEESDSETDWESGQTIEETIKFIEEAKSFHFDEWNNFVVARRNINDKFDFNEEVLLFAVLKSPKIKLEKFISKIQSLGDDFILRRPDSILIYDGRNSVVGYIENYLEDDSLTTYNKDLEEKFASLGEDKIVELYEEYQKDCKEFGEKIYPDESSKSFVNFKKNMMDA